MIAYSAREPPLPPAYPFVQHEFFYIDATTHAHPYTSLRQSIAIPAFGASISHQRPPVNVVMKDDENATVKMQKIKLEDGINGAAAAHHPDSTTGAVTDATKAIKLDGSPSPSTEGGKSRSDGNGTPNSSRPRLSRKSSQKPTPTREPPLFDSLPNMTPEACKSFQVIPDCLYGSKHLGSTENDAFDCDCREEWRKLAHCPLT